MSPELPGSHLHGVHGEHVCRAGDVDREHPRLYTGTATWWPTGAFLHRRRGSAGAATPTVNHTPCHTHSSRHALQTTR